MAKKQTNDISTSDHNLMKIGTKDLKKHLMGTIDINGAAIVVGRRGSGKTEICHQAIRDINLRDKEKKVKVEENGKEVTRVLPQLRTVYLNLSLLERVDLGGYPNVMGAGSQDYISFIMPDFYKAMCEGDQPVVAILDEVDKADPSLWAPLLEFVQFRSINGKVLKNLKAIFMTGNLLAEGGQKPSPPLLDRAEKYLVEPDYTEWLHWSGTEGRIHPSITAFINDNPKYLFGGIDLEDKYSDTSPRSWTIASRILTAGDALGWDTQLLSDKVAGCVGKQAAVHYDVYFKHFHKLSPIVAKVFEGKEKEAITAIVNQDPHARIVATMMVASKYAMLLDKALENGGKKGPPVTKSVGNFLSAMPPEIALVCIRSNLSITKLMAAGIDESPEWKRMIDDLVKMITGRN